MLAIAAAMARSDPAARRSSCPIALAAVLFSVLFDPRVSLFASVMLATLIGLQPPYHGSSTLFLLLMAGAASAFSVRVIRRRDQAYYSILVTAGAYALAELGDRTVRRDAGARDLVRDSRRRDQFRRVGGARV